MTSRGGGGSSNPSYSGEKISETLKRMKVHGREKVCRNTSLRGGALFLHRGEASKLGEGGSHGPQNREGKSAEVPSFKEAGKKKELPPSRV